MLEKVKPGNLCIFSNGDQARVTKVEVTPAGNYDLYFNKPVQGSIAGCTYSDWVYERNGKLSNLTGNEYISIVKLIAE